MTEWSLIIALFWVWFLADCFKISRHTRFSFSHFRGPGRARIATGRILSSAPFPSAWQAVTDDPPYSFSPDGLANVPACSASLNAHDPAAALAWRWEDITEITQKRGRIHINGADFCAVSVFGNAAGLRALVARVSAAPFQARAALLHAHLARWFRPAHLRRRLLSLTARTRDLALLGVFNFALALAVTVYLIGDGPALVGDALAARIAAALPLLGAYFALIHVAVVILAWRAHRKMMPARGEERARVLLNAFMLPPHALHLRAQIGAVWFPSQHPLSWLAATGRPADFACYARRTLADLRWPLAPRPHSAGSSGFTIADWMRLQISPHVTRLLAGSRLDESQLLQPPAADSADSCSYCPRCLDQFTRPDARCPRGVTLRALK